MLLKIDFKPIVIELINKCISSILLDLEFQKVGKSLLFSVLTHQERMKIQLTLYHVGGGSARTPPWRYHLPFCGGCTNQFQISWLFPITSLLSSGKVIFHFFFCNFYKKITVKIFFRPKKQRFFDKNGQNHFFLTNIDIYCFKIVFSMLWEIFWGALHVCMSKIDDVEIRSTSVSFLSFRNLEAASEEAMQLRRLIKSSNESLWPYLFGKFEFWNF